MGSICVVAVVLIGICLFRRRRRQKVMATDPVASLPTAMPYADPAFYSGASLKGQRNKPTSKPSGTEEEKIQRRESSHPLARPAVESRPEEAGDDTLASMRHVAEVREEVARLRQFLIGSQQLSGSDSPTPDQTSQLSEMREEIQRLRHLVSLQPSDRQNIFDGVSGTTSPPVYEE